MLNRIEFTNMPILEVVPLYKDKEIQLIDFTNETEEWDAFDIYTPIADEITLTTKNKEYYKKYIKGHNRIRVYKNGITYEVANYLKKATQDCNTVYNGIHIFYLFDFALYNQHGTPKIEIKHIERKELNFSNEEAEK